MRSFGYLVLIGLFQTCLTVLPCCADGPQLTVNTVLEKWEKASQECEVFDTKAKVYKYNSVFSADKPTICYARFYYESSGIGCFVFSENADFETNRWSDIQDMVIWHRKDSLWIDTRSHVVRRIAIKKVQESLDHEPDEGFFASLMRPLLSPFIGPQIVAPLMVDVHAEEIRKTYDISLDKHDNDILITAIPRKDSKMSLYYSKIKVLLDSKTYLTKAIERIDLGNRSSVSLVLYDKKVNEKPTDRDQLIEPDLSGFVIADVM